MKKSLFALSLLVVFILSSCNKEEAKPDTQIDWDSLETCEWNPSEVADQSVWTKYTLKPIVYSEDCNCIVSGFEKYLKNGVTAIMINYGSGECDDYGLKVICPDGKCEGKNAQKCKFETLCEVK